MNDYAKQPTENRPALLLHACCGPCSLEPTRLLQEQGYAPDIFYSNANIAPADEYQHRWETLSTWAENEDISAIQGAYAPAEWEATAGIIGEAAFAEAREKVAAERARVAADGQQAAMSNVDNPTAGPAAIDHSAAAVHTADSPTTVADTAAELPLDLAAALAVDSDRRRARCRACYRLRLEASARYAAEHGYEALGTTLTVSIYQYVDIIREELERACAAYGLTPVFEDFRPQFDEAERRSKALGMYRQNYCGCRFSDLEAQAGRAERRAAIKAAKAADRAAHAEERAQAAAEAAARKAEKQAYAEKQRRKRELLKSLRQEKPQ